MYPVVFESVDGRPETDFSENAAMSEGGVDFKARRLGGDHSDSGTFDPVFAD